MNGVSYKIFLCVLIFSPLAFGTVEPWSLAVMEIGSFAALFLFLKQSRSDGRNLHTVPGIIPLTVLNAYMLLQLVPLPPGLLRLISPETYLLYADTAGIDGPLPWLPLTINRKATLGEFFRLSSYAAFYCLTVELLSGRDLLKKTVTVLIVAASALSLLAIMQHLLSNGRIYWIRELTQGGVPFGPYVNRNHYAGLMGMIFPVALGMFLYYKPDVSYGSFRDRLAEALNQKITNIHILLGCAAVVIAVSLFLSLSRGGIVSLSISMICFGLLLIYKAGKSRRGILIIAVFLVVAYAVGWFGWEPVFERFARIRDDAGQITEQRLTIWKDSTGIMRDFAAAGTGFGTYMNIYPRYRSWQGELVDHAHNDYLELMTDGGLIAVSLFGWFVISVLYRSFTVFLRRREPYSLHLCIGALAGIIALLIHSITDFNLRIGANGLYFFFLAGLAVSAANTRFHGSEATSLKNLSSPRMGAAGLVMAGFLLCLTVLFNISHIAGEAIRSGIDRGDLTEQTPRERLVSVRGSLERASAVDPVEGANPYLLARVSQFLSADSEAVRQYRRAVMLDPANGEYLQMYGLALSVRGDDDRAEKYLTAGVAADPQNIERHRRYALWLFSQERTDDGMRVLSRAIALEPLRTRDYITMMVLNGLGDTEIQRALPDISEPHVRYAEYLAGVAGEPRAGDAYLRAFSVAEKDGNALPGIFLRIYSYFRKTGRHDVALMVMQKASERYPDNISILVNAAQAYEDSDLTYRAVEHYRQALLIDPGNRTAQSRLNALQRGQ